jgi:hypothetical protein
MRKIDYRARRPDLGMYRGNVWYDEENEGADRGRGFFRFGLV